jgi:hypothetical protein
MSLMSWKSFKVGVRSKSAEKWTYNALRFADERHAEAYAKDLMLRWKWVKETTVSLSEDEPNALFPVPDSTYTVERLDRFQFVPRPMDIAWANQMIELIKEGGTLIYPATDMIYEFHHSEKTLVLKNPSQLVYIDSLLIHLRTVATFEKVGWTVIQDEREGEIH